MTYDAIVIGAGHNGLVCACYLAKAGRRVLVLERREVVGGACVTEEPWPGFKVSTAAYVNSLFRPQIARELRLRDYGFELLARNPSSFTPFLDERYLMLGPQGAANVREIGKFSRRDAERYPQYEAMLQRVAAIVEPTIDEAPPDVLKPTLADLKRLWMLQRRLRNGASPASIGEALEVLTGAARPILDRWFESEQLKGTLATDAIIGAFAAPSMPGTAYVLFHHVMGESDGVRGVWSYVRGGMGGLTQALAAAARDLGVEIRTASEVGRIVVRGGAAVGVALANGDEFSAKRIASNADCNVTFLKLLAEDALSPEIRAAIEKIDYSGASMKINLALDSLPAFTACAVSCRPERSERSERSRRSNESVGPEHRGTIHFCPDQDFIEHAYDDAKYGEPSREPVVEMTIPSSVDETLAPAGRHVASMFVQYAPYKLREGSWTQARRDEVADRCFTIVERYAPGFTSSVLHRQILAPPDLEETFSLTGGNIFQGAMSLNQLFAFRPLPGYARYGTPVKDLYLCGSAAHPGGGVMGAAGRNAAREMLRR
ncbi:MAG: phytoene desaturase family protein [Candidatus Tyrphobacter sp.]